jgi:hypothetical protein
MTPFFITELAPQERGDIRKARNTVRERKRRSSILRRNTKNSERCGKGTARDTGSKTGVWPAWRIRAVSAMTTPSSSEVRPAKLDIALWQRRIRSGDRDWSTARSLATSARHGRHAFVGLVRRHAFEFADVRELVIDLADCRLHRSRSAFAKLTGIRRLVAERQPESRSGSGISATTWPRCSG